MAKKYNGKGKGKSKKVLKRKLKTGDVTTVPYKPDASTGFVAGIYNSGESCVPGISEVNDFNTKFDDAYIKLENFNLKPAPYTPWYTKLLNFFKKL